MTDQAWPIIEAAYALARSRQMCCRADLQLLIRMVRGLPPNPVVIQLGAGSGTMGLAVMGARRDVTLWSFDIDQQALNWEWQVLQNAKVDLKHGRRYIPRHQDSIDGGCDWLWGPVDLVIIDSDHSHEGVLGDLAAWAHRADLVFVHDYDGTDAPQQYPGVRQACDEMWGDTVPLYKRGWSAVFTGAMIELPGDLADTLADEAGIYADPRCAPDGSSGLGGHVEDCGCRVYWVPDITRRMRDAVHAEDKLNA